MLVSALGATLVGFALLVVALATGNLWLAVACIVICVAGALLLLADTLGLRPRRSRTAPAGGEADADAPTEQFDRITDDSVVTLRDDEPATVEHPGAVDDPVADEASDPAVPPSRHGRHERPGLDEDLADSTADGTPVDPPRRGRHGTPE